MRDLNILTNETLLELANRDYVAWAFMRLCSVYKYVGLFI